MNDEISKHSLVVNVESMEVTENNLVSETILVMWLARLLTTSFNIFLQSTDSKAIPDRDPRAVQAEIKKKITHVEDIDNVRYTRNGCIIFSTKDIHCASKICNWPEFLCVTVKIWVVWENILNKFLIFNIPVDTLLAELGQDIAETNSIKILKLRILIKKDSHNKASPVLLTSLGTNLLAEIKLWSSILLYSSVRGQTMPMQQVS